MPAAPQRPSSINFGFLREHEEALVLLAAQAETLFPIDPVASIVKVRLFAELLAQEVAAHVGVYTSRDEYTRSEVRAGLPIRSPRVERSKRVYIEPRCSSRFDASLAGRPRSPRTMWNPDRTSGRGYEAQLELLRKLRQRGAIGGQADQSFHAIRKAGNAAVHKNEGDHGAALHCLKLARSLAVWFHRCIGRKHSFDPPPFVPPRPPVDATVALRAELEQARTELASANQAALQSAEAALNAAVDLTTTVKLLDAAILAAAFRVERVERDAPSPSVAASP